MGIVPVTVTFRYTYKCGNQSPVNNTVNVQGYAEVDPNTGVNIAIVTPAFSASNYPFNSYRYTYQSDSHQIVKGGGSTLGLGTIRFTSIRVASGETIVWDKLVNITHNFNGMGCVNSSPY